MKRSVLAVAVLASCSKPSQVTRSDEVGEAARAAVMDETDADGVADKAPTAPAAVARATGSSAPAVQAAGPVKAGEWDDNANYRDYVKWLAGDGARTGAQRLDVRDRRFVVVRDAAGKPVPNCPVRITGDNQATASLVTTATGRAIVFPHAMQLGGAKTLTATALCGAQPTATLDARLDGIAELVIGPARALPARRTVDLAFVLDTTGSMAEEIDAVKNTVRTVASTLGTEQTDVRIGLVEYKDRTDDTVTRVFPFSANLGAFARDVAELQASGGGDVPEDMHAGLTAALDKLAWRADATARIVVVIADAPPHLDYADQAQTDYAATARRAAAQGIKLFTVAASGMDLTGQVVMRQLAQFTGGSNLFVLRGGAGAASVGGGDPGSSCGGTQQQYATGNLDQLIVAKVKGELRALDADPRRIAGLGGDENAKPCDQRVVIAN